MKANSPRSSHLPRAVSKKQFPVRTAFATGLRPLLLWLLLTLPAVVQAQFNYTTENGMITITGYTGPGGAVAIPATINGRPVTRIRYNAFRGNTSLTSVTIPSSVTSIGYSAFESCASLTSVTIPNSVTRIYGVAFAYCSNLSAITVDALNSVYSSVDGVLFDKSQTALIKCPGGKAGSYTIPSRVTIIVYGAFAGCNSLISVTIPNSVTGIMDGAFVGCASLTGVYFQGNAPIIGHFFEPWDPDDVFAGSDNLTVYYLPGTTGWETTFAKRLTALWSLPYPVILNSSPSFGVQTNAFGFVISWATDISVVVEATTSLANPAWFPVGTNTLTGGSSYFSDPEWTNHPARFYRLRSP